MSCSIYSLLCPTETFDKILRREGKTGERSGKEWERQSMKQFGAFLANLRSSAGLSLEELGKLVGTSRSTLSRLENDDIPRPFKSTMRQLVILLAELLCTSQKETEWYLELAVIERSYLTDTEEIALGFIPAILVGSAEEAANLEHLCGMCEQRYYQFDGWQQQLQQEPFAGEERNLYKQIRRKKQECALILREIQQRLDVLSQSSIIIIPGTHISQAIQERLDQAESITNLAWEAWFGSRPKQVAREIIKLLPMLEKMISMPLAIVHVLHIKELVIRCHGLLGTIYLDAMQNDSALYHYMQAHKFAEEIRDANLIVTYLALTGDVLRQQNDKAAALRYMENARDRAAAANRATLGHVLQLLAYTYGDIGNEAAFEQAISEATDLLAFAGEGRDTVRKEFIPFEVYEIRGKATRDLGKPLNALPYLELAEKSLDKAESVTPRWQALLGISRGQAFCDAGDITTGLDLISKSFLLAYQCHSPHQMNRVRKLLRKLGNSPSRNHPGVQNLKDLLYETYMRIENEAL